MIALKKQILMCNDKNYRHTSFGKKAIASFGNAVTFYVQQNLFCYNRSHLGWKTVCFERDITAPNTLTSHHKIQPDRA